MDDFSTFPVMVHQKHKSIIFLAQLYIMARLLWQITLKQIIIQNLIRIVKSGNWKHYWSKWTFASYWQQPSTLPCLMCYWQSYLADLALLWKTCFEVPYSRFKILSLQKLIYGACRKIGQISSFFIICNCKILQEVWSN